MNKTHYEIRSLALLLTFLLLYQPPSKMTKLTLELMKQLLSDQTQLLTKELTAHIKKEVDTQLQAHVARLDQLEAEHEDLKKLLYKLKGELGGKETFPNPKRIQDTITHDIEEHPTLSPYQTTISSPHDVREQPMPSPHDAYNPAGRDVQGPRFDDVKTIFRFVRNLPQGVKVRNYIPPCLSSDYNYLTNRAYQLRNGETPYRTVVRYVGD